MSTDRQTDNSVSLSASITMTIFDEFFFFNQHFQHFVVFKTVKKALQAPKWFNNRWCTDQDNAEACIHMACNMPNIIL